jgi:glyoxylase-like metal-dependent hydrolase (beta-lactamase superfamily II)
VAAKDRIFCPFEVHPIVHPKGCRSYVVVDPETGDALVVDPLLDRLGETRSLLSSRRGTLRWIVDTHTHGDHLSGASALRGKTGADVVMSAATDCPVATKKVAEGDVLPLGENSVKVRAAPGNAPDGIVLEAPGALFTGDTLLVGTVGRRDVPGWDAAAHFDTLQRIFDPLHEATAIYPGHDDMGRDRTDVKAERRGNKWLREKDRDTFVTRLKADPRPVGGDDEILLANRQGAPAPPEAAEGGAAEEAGPGAAPGAVAGRGGALVPSGLADLMLLGGSVALAGTALGFLWDRVFLVLPAAVSAGAIAVGVTGRARRKPKTIQGLYYLGPVRKTPTP